MWGAILAAGRGERLRRCGVEVPKPLVEVDGSILLLRQTRELLDAGASRVVAVINSETAEILAKNRFAPPAALTLVTRDTANSMETLFALGSYIDSPLFLAATVDAVAPHFEVRRFAREGMGQISGLAGALGVVRWRGDKRPLFARFDREGWIESLGDADGDWVTAGFYLLPAAIFDYIPRARMADMTALRQFLAGLISWGMKLRAIEMHGVIDVDDGADLIAARHLLRIERPEGS